MNLEYFLEKKPLYYNEIDYQRMPRIYNKIKSSLPQVKIIHLVGTNGKGTTGRFLATALYHLNYKVGHYTSPHILEFNERIWLHGSNVSDSTLEKAHRDLQNILSTEDSEALSYFEYTTFLAILIFKDVDYVILEAGLGGQHDATAVFPKILTLVTPIDYDHEAFLGSHISDIAAQKLNAIQNNAIIAIQKHGAVAHILQDIQAKKKIKVFSIDELLESEDEKKIIILSEKLSLVKYLENNLRLSISALKFLNIPYEIDSFTNSKLFGRLTQFQKNIYLDVGHNPLAASSIVKALKNEKYILIYNTYKDKDYKKILQILQEIIKHVEIINIHDFRIEKNVLLYEVLTELEIKYATFKTIKKSEKYLVFGSFRVVEAFLREYNE
ncbi:bifunctional folylpolyglutamate synthase/dihydrofolate synthase [Sulfurimonas sp. SAG-AH-194-I05]|nr:bifunctional folylpolyglutamate synthase/dihydrofolate synthase [Sulfurimonas sp. SAG-AH-194-I05]MDF1874657.1 bifunctional folylpolyglutamate synthase/dihydrofolate synthase [Sulfurimonas sp. SAG-AH-194-I05]